MWVCCCVTFTHRGRRLSSVGGRAPIRLGFNTSAVTSASQALSLSASQRALLVNNVIPDAQARLQALLKVDPVRAFGVRENRGSGPAA